MNSLKKEWEKIYKEEGRDRALNYYMENLHVKNQKRFNKDAKQSGIPEGYDYLIITAGLVKHYYILLIDYIKPKHIVWICSNHFEDDYLPYIKKHIKHKSARHIVFSKTYDEITITSTYQSIKSIEKQFNNMSVLLEMTAGKNIMSAGAGVMACFKEFDICYVDIEWNSDLKTGSICSEKLVKVRNPLLVFGDYTMNYADGFFRKGLYKSASDLYLQLTKQVEDPRLFEIKKIVSDAYYAWDNFNYKLAKELLTKILILIKQYNYSELERTIENNLSALECLELYCGVGNGNIKLLADSKKIIYLLLDIHSNGVRKKQMGLFDDSILLFYRVIELVSQHRLAKYGIDTSNPNEKLLLKYKDQYFSLSKAVFGIEQNLHSDVGNKNGHLLLFCMKDKLWQNKKINDLKSLFDLLRTRDQSFFAHGFSFNSPKTSEKYEKFSMDIIKSLFSEKEIIRINSLLSKVSI